MNRPSANQCSLRTLHGNDADPVDPKQTPGWQTALLVAAGPPLLPRLAQADRAEPSRINAQTAIAAGTLIMTLASPACGNLASKRRQKSSRRDLTQMQPDLTDRLVAALSDGTTLHRIALGSTLDQRAARRDSAIQGEGTGEWASI